MKVLIRLSIFLPLILVSCNKSPTIAGIELTSRNFEISSGDLEGYVLADSWPISNDTVQKNQKIFEVFSVSNTINTEQRVVEEKGQRINMTTTIYMVQDRFYDYALLEVKKDLVGSETQYTVAFKIK